MNGCFQPDEAVASVSGRVGRTCSVLAEAPPLLGRHRSVSEHRLQQSLLCSQTMAHVMTHKMDSLPSAMTSLDGKDLSVDNKDSNSGQGLFFARKIPATPTNDHGAFR